MFTFAGCEAIKQQDMKSKPVNLILFLTVLLFFTACEVEFDPNEEWKQVTVVYGVLDQDADTTFIRVQKGFLGSGNYLDFSKKKDSIYYNQNDIDVFMLSYYPWEKEIVRDTFWFEYTETRNKPEGNFYNEVTPMYRCITKNKLNHTEALKQEYKIVVRNKKTGDETWATTRLIGDYDITAPGSIMYFIPKNGKNLMSCSWYNINSSVASNGEGITAKVFQPSMRFYYRANGEETFTDIDLAMKLNTNTNSGFEFSYNIDMDDIINGIKRNLSTQSGHCSWTNRQYAFELYVNSCSQEMYEYYSNSRQNNNQLSDKPIYTNVSNGYGLFAARRKNIKLTFTKEDEKLQTAIKALNYGF